MKESKSKTFDQNPYHPAFDLGCGPHGLNKDDQIVLQVEAVEQQLNMIKSTEILQNITDSSLKVAGEMFLFINSCPYDLQYWFKFYADLFKNKSPDIITLTLNRMLKRGNQRNKRLKTIVKKLFTRVTSLLSLKYEEIQNGTQGLGNFSLKGGTWQHFISIMKRQSIHFELEDILNFCNPSL